MVVSLVYLFQKNIGIIGPVLSFYTSKSTCLFHQNHPGDKTKTYLVDLGNLCKFQTEMSLFNAKLVFIVLGIGLQLSEPENVVI